MEEILRILADKFDYKIDSYDYMEYEDILELPEFVMILGLSVLIKDYKMKTSNSELNIFLLSNRDDLVHFSDITKIKDKKGAENKLKNILKSVTLILMK